MMHLGLKKELHLRVDTDSEIKGGCLREASAPLSSSYTSSGCGARVNLATTKISFEFVSLGFYCITLRCAWRYEAATCPSYTNISTAGSTYNERISCLGTT